MKLSDEVKVCFLVVLCICICIGIMADCAKTTNDSPASFFRNMEKIERKYEDK